LKDLRSEKHGGWYRNLWRTMISDTVRKKIEALPAILSIQEAADFFSVRYLTVYRLIHAGKLPAWKDSEGRWCIARADLKRFLLKNTSL